MHPVSYLHKLPYALFCSVIRYIPPRERGPLYDFVKLESVLERILSGMQLETDAFRKYTESDKSSLRVLMRSVIPNLTAAEKFDFECQKIAYESLFLTVKINRKKEDPTYYCDVFYYSCMQGLSPNIKTILKHQCLDQAEIECGLYTAFFSAYSKSANTEELLESFKKFLKLYQFTSKEVEMLLSYGEDEFSKLLLSEGKIAGFQPGEMMRLIALQPNAEPLYRKAIDVLDKKRIKETKIPKRHQMLENFRKKVQSVKISQYYGSS